MNDDFLRYCIDFFGKDKQMAVAIEEMAEFTQQLCKFMIGHKNAKRENVVEEFVDVTIMLNQMKIIFNITDEEIESARTFKLERLKKYIYDMKVRN